MLRYVSIMTITETSPEDSILDDIDAGDFYDEDGNGFLAWRLFKYAVQVQCSDIHLKQGAKPKIRVNGNLEDIENTQPLTQQHMNEIRSETMSDEDFGIWANTNYSHSYAYALTVGGRGRFRMQIAKTVSGLSIVARRLVDTPPSFEDLGTNPVIRDLHKLESGLIIVSGITGSGKSTLMAALINEINASRAANIISIEEPVEIIHPDQKSIITQRNVGTDTPSFAEGIRDAMRQDPDIILIGEIRDEETAHACLKAAETGHLVITTIHAMSATASVGRFLDQFPPDEQQGVRNRFSDVLRAIIGQKLVRTLSETTPRTAVNEILLNDSRMKATIENPNTTPTELRNTLISTDDIGAQTFEAHLAHLTKEGIIAKSVAIAQANDVADLRKLLTTPLPTGVPDIMFSELVKHQEEEEGKVVVISSAAPVLPTRPINITPTQPPVRPNLKK